MRELLAPYPTGLHTTFTFPERGWLCHFRSRSCDDVLISGFGKFYIKKNSARKERNPATGEDLTLDGRTVVGFGCSPVLRDKFGG